MSAMSDLHYEIQLMAHQMGDDYGVDDITVETIAEELGVTTDEVIAVLNGDVDYDPQEYEDDAWMDADALASAGFGTNEDYGYYEDEGFAYDE